MNWPISCWLSGKGNQTRCFLHMINLVAKSVIQQFEMHDRSAVCRPDEPTNWFTIIVTNNSIMIMFSPYKLASTADHE